jgi:cytochrome c
MGLIVGWGRAAVTAEGDAALGRQVFGAYCAKCHSFDPAEAGKRGPHLAGLLTRRYGSVPGFPYRMVWPLADPVWTTEQLDAYLEIHRLAEPKIRADVIAFLYKALK